MIPERHCAPFVPASNLQGSLKFWELSPFAATSSNKPNAFGRIWCEPACACRE